MRTTTRTGPPGVRTRAALLAVLAAGCAPQVSSTEHLRASGVEPSAAQVAWLTEVCTGWLEPLRVPYPVAITETELVGWELDRYRQAAAALRRSLAGPSPFPATRDALAAALEPLTELDGDGPTVLAAVERQAEDVFAAAVGDVASFEAVESCAGAPWGVEPPTAAEIATGVARALQLEAEDGERSPRSLTLVADLFDRVVDATVTPTAAFELDGRLQVHLPYEDDDAWWCVTVPDHAELDAAVGLAPGRC
jgi:hypothetical protein